MARFLAEVFSSAGYKIAVDWPGHRAVDSSHCACALTDSCKLVADIRSLTNAAGQECHCGCRIAGYFADDRKDPVFDPRSVASRSQDILADSAAANPLESLDIFATFVDLQASVERHKVAVELSLVVVLNRKVWLVKCYLQQLKKCRYIFREEIKSALSSD